jgi:hypothetical protein
MAEIRQISGKGKRGLRGAAKDVNTRKRKVKGYGVDRLRTAAERRMAESSEELAESLMSKALAGKLESVKILMKLAEEEKARREEKREEDAPGLAELLVGSVVKVGQMWDGHHWRRVAPSRLLAEKCAKAAELVDINEDIDGDDLEEAA